MIALSETIQAAPSTGSRAGLTDEQIMGMIQAHVHDGLHLLHDRYARLLKCLSMRVLQNDADADELIQDVFVEIWERSGNYDPLKGRPLSWLATLTRRRSIDRIRKRETHSRFEVRFAVEVEVRSHGWTHVHEDICHADRNARLQLALASLPEAQRQAILLAYHGRMSQREIAASTGIPLGTIKTRLELALRKLAVSLSGFEDLLWAGDHAPGMKNRSTRDTANSEALAISNA